MIQLPKKIIFSILALIFLYACDINTSSVDNEFHNINKSVTNWDELQPATNFTQTLFSCYHNGFDYVYLKIVVNYGEVIEGSQKKYHISVTGMTYYSDYFMDEHDPSINYMSMHPWELDSIGIDFAESFYYNEPISISRTNSSYLRYQTDLMPLDYEFSIGKIMISVNYTDELGFQKNHLETIIDNPVDPVADNPSCDLYHADINGDSYDDLIHVEIDNNFGYIGLGRSDGTVEKWTHTSYNPGATNNYSHYFADINGDGRADWIQVSKDSNAGWIGLGQLDGSIDHWTHTSNNPGDTNNYSHYFADINGDGRADWIQVSKNSDVGWIGLGQLDGNIDYWTNYSNSRGATNNYSHYFADINGDGRADWIQVSKNSDAGWIGLGQLDGNIDHWTNYSISRGATNNYSHYFADINGDGRADWIQTYRYSELTYIGLGQTNGDIQHWTSTLTSGL